MLSGGNSLGSCCCSYVSHILKTPLSSLLALTGNSAYNEMFRDARNCHPHTITAPRMMRQPIDLVVPFVRAFRCSVTTAPTIETCTTKASVSASSR